MSKNILTISDDDFEQKVLNAELPVLVDFWADWCGPCKAIAPILDDIAKTYAGKLLVAKVNIDQNEVTPQKYGVRGIPTLMLFKDGELTSTKVGSATKSQIMAFINSNI